MKAVTCCKIEIIQYCLKHQLSVRDFRFSRRWVWRSESIWLQGCTSHKTLNIIYLIHTFKEAKQSRHDGPWGERKYSTYSFLTSALDGGEWSASRRSRALPPGKWPPVPIVHEAGWAPEPVWTQRLEEKSFPLSGIEPRSPSRLVRSQTLYCLSYPAPLHMFRV
jgi:hypothetical protein